MTSSSFYCSKLNVYQIQCFQTDKNNLLRFIYTLPVNINLMSIKCNLLAQTEVILLGLDQQDYGQQKQWFILSLYTIWYHRVREIDFK